MNGFDDNNQQGFSHESPYSEQESGSPDSLGPDVISGAEAVKKSPKKLILIIAAIVAVLVIGCISAYAFIPQVKNTVKMLLSSPEGYYAWVEEKNSNDETDKLMNALKDDDREFEGCSAELSVDIDKDSLGIKEAAANAADGTSPQVPGKIAFGSKSALIDGVMSTNGVLKLDGNDALSINIYLKEGKRYFQLPDLSADYIEVDIASMLESAVKPGDDSKFSDQLTAYVKDSLTKLLIGGKSAGKRIISNDDLEKLIKKYSKVIYENIKNVKLDKNCEVEADGIKSEYTKLTASIDEGTLMSIAKDALKELKDDDIIIKVLSESFGQSEDEYKTAVDKALESIEKYDLKGGRELLVMTVYVNSRGEIVGREFTSGADYDKDIELGYAVTYDDDKYGFEAHAFGEFSARASYTKDDDKYSGEGTITVKDGNDISISFEDFKCDPEKKEIDGKLTVGAEKASVTLDMDINDDSQDVKWDVKMDGKKAVSAEADIKLEAPDKITVFSEGSKKYSSDQIADYINSADNTKFSEFMKKLFKGLGVNNELVLGQLDNPASIEALKENFVGSLRKTAENIVGEANQVLDGDGLPTTVPSDNTADVPAISEDVTAAADDGSTQVTDVECDMSKVKVMLGGQEIKFFETKGSLLTGMGLKFDDDTVKPGKTVYGSSEDFSVSASVTNNTTADAKAEDCVVGYIFSTNEGAGLTVDGAAVGSDIKALADKWGAQLKDPNKGMLSANGYVGKTFYSANIDYMNGKITSISTSAYLFG